MGNIQTMAFWIFFTFDLLYITIIVNGYYYLPTAGCVAVVNRGAEDDP